MGQIATYMNKHISSGLIYKKVITEVASICSVGRQASCDTSKLKQELNT